MRTRAMLGAAMLGGLACGERGEKAGPAADSTPAPPADSLVATAPGGTEVWFTLARPDSGEGGRCTDRAIEIRRGAARIPVPLLYTGTAPQMVDDTTLALCARGLRIRRFRRGASCFPLCRLRRAGAAPLPPWRRSCV